MFLRFAVLAAALCAGGAPAAAEPAPGGAAAAAHPYATVVVPRMKTSIYVGSVALEMTALTRNDAGRYDAGYKARVTPYFFCNESGRLWIDFSDEQLAQLERGERVAFTGGAKTAGGKERRVEGHATPSAPGVRDGKIKVRVFVTAKTQLIFNTTYRFAETSATGAPSFIGGAPAL
ncbi:hypothetical protein OH491_14150 [Termitidicoccus mucosus]|uniref:Uncharacterized protein n=1 Tax=Termitidicoccus mucosus TaxID=1184151 RepID=A0A178IJZ5_9BACT|nr:hypothetical protein AW736_13300 [Opitutaceae bacterium TSB47]